MIEKVKRLEALATAGFNIPDFLFVPFYPTPEDYARAVEYCNIHATMGKKINVRTYKPGKNEGVNNPHLLQQNPLDILNQLDELTKTYNLMIEDIETPYSKAAGNVIIEHGRWIIDYIIADGMKAVVRNADHTISGMVRHDWPENPMLRKILDKAIMAKHFHGYVLEWSWFATPQGRKKQNDVWWEYRNA